MTHVRRIGRRRVVSDPPRRPSTPQPAAGGEPDDVAPEPSLPSEQVPPEQVPPAQTRDDTDAGWGERPETGHDRWLQEQRPPHWE